MAKSIKSNQPGESLKEIKQDLEDLKKYIEEFTLFLPLSFCIVNPFHLIVGINQAFKDLTGYNEMEVIGKDVSLLFSDEKEIGLFKTEISETDKKIAKELILLRKNGTTVPVNIVALARKGEKGSFQGYFLTISDISEAKSFQGELERKVKEKTKELQEKMEELERFNRLAVGRELKMIDLKKEIRKLKKELTPK